MSAPACCVLENYLRVLQLLTEFGARLDERDRVLIEAVLKEAARTVPGFTWERILNEYRFRVDPVVLVAKMRHPDGVVN